MQYFRMNITVYQTISLHTSGEVFLLIVAYKIM